MSQTKDGGYCPMCDTVWASPGKCRCKVVELTATQEAIMQAWQYDKEARTLRHIETWNAAIEAAADEIENHEFQLAEQIRKLKK